MKKISLSIVAILFAAASVMASGTPVHSTKKTKQADCTKCDKSCTKDCADKADCSKMDCGAKK